ncbi:MAG: hypothetical protein EOP17_05960 [Rhizobiaceae bacterium]|nr:MAG: hypothetical protein EOP17_05960 [Rhizobiaceae bacterium]
MLRGLAVYRFQARMPTSADRGKSRKENYQFPQEERSEKKHKGPSLDHRPVAGSLDFFEFLLRVPVFHRSEAKPSVVVERALLHPKLRIWDQGGAAISSERRFAAESIVLPC